jgi:hypothetical protein
MKKTIKNRPLTAKEAPDTARVYERAKPEAEGGMGRLDNIKGTPVRGNDKMFDAVPNAHPSHQINAEDTIDSSASEPLTSAARKQKAKKR